MIDGLVRWQKKGSVQGRRGRSQRPSLGGRGWGLDEQVSYPSLIKASHESMIGAHDGKGVLWGGEMIDGLVLYPGHQIHPKRAVVSRTRTNQVAQTF
jgi:hypothetical protein